MAQTGTNRAHCDLSREKLWVFLSSFLRAGANGNHYDNLGNVKGSTQDERER